MVAKAETDYAAKLLPEMIRAGVIRFAFVIPESAFTQLSIKRFANSFGTDKSLEMQYFENREAARLWLLKG